MKCPKCSHAADPTVDQAVAGGAAIASGLTVAWGGLFGMIAAPYLVPVVLGGLLWNACRKVTCPKCGHRFTCFQEGQ